MADFEIAGAVRDVARAITDLARALSARKPDVVNVYVVNKDGETQVAPNMEK